MIVHVGVPTTSYPRFAGDVAGSFVRALCLELVDRGHRCTVFAPADPNARESAPPLVDEGIELVPIEARLPGVAPAFYGAGFPDNVARAPSAWLAAGAFVGGLARALHRRRGALDAVLSHWALPSALVSHAVMPERPQVAIWHSADVRLAERALGRRAWPLLRGMADEHVFVAAHLAARLGARASAHVVPMGVRSPSTDPTSRSSRGHRAPRCLVLARLVPIKGIALAIEASARVGVELVVAGEGPERASLEAHARSLGAQVCFVGALDEASKRRAFDDADVFLATSEYAPRGPSEGYPVAPREALAHGLVVLATRNPAHDELARAAGEPVVLAPREGFAQALEALVRDEARLARLSALAPASVERDAWPLVAARIEALLVDARRRAERRQSSIGTTLGRMGRAKRRASRRAP